MVENSTNSGKEKTDNSPESKEKTFLQKIYEFFFYFSALQKGLRIYCRKLSIGTFLSQIL